MPVKNLHEFSRILPQLSILGECHDEEFMPNNSLKRKKTNHFFWKAFGDLAGMGYPPGLYSHGVGMAPKPLGQE